MLTEFLTFQGWKKKDLDQLRALESYAATCSDKEFLPTVERALPLFSEWGRPLTNAKEFCKYGHIGSKSVNKRGLHLFRVVFANMAAQRYMKNETFLNRGVLLIPQFLDTKAHRIALRAMERVKVYRASKSDKNQPTRELIFAVNAIRKFVLGLWHNPGDELYDEFNRNTFVQRVVMKPGRVDKQMYAHQDIFFPALKWWYFPQAVNKNEGSFCYSSDSATLTPKVLEWHYHESVRTVGKTVESWRNPGHREGSLRVSPKELKEMGLFMSPTLVPANTLVVANVFGFHKRGTTDKRFIRTALHGSMRTQRPFDADQSH